MSLCQSHQVRLRPPTPDVYPHIVGEGEGTGAPVSRQGKSLDERFDGVWGSESSPQHGQGDQPMSLFSAKINPESSLTVAEQMAGPSAIARYLQQRRSESGGISSSQESPEPGMSQQDYPSDPSDPALPPLQGIGHQGMSVPEGSEVPQASLGAEQTQDPLQSHPLNDFPQEDQAGHTRQEAVERTQEERQEGLTPPGLTPQGSKDVNLAKPREQLANLNVGSTATATKAPPTASNIGGSRFESSRQPKSTSATPKSAAGTFPTSIESPSKPLKFFHHKC